MLISIRFTINSNTLRDRPNPYSTVPQNELQKVYLLKHITYRKQRDKDSSIFSLIPLIRLHLCYRYHYIIIELE